MNIAKTLLRPVLLACCTILLLDGCASKTTAPPVFRPVQASFDAVADSTGDNQTSGVYGWRVSDNQMVISPGGLRYYNWCLSRYGASLIPPVTNQNFGVSDYTNDIIEALITNQTPSGEPLLSKPFKRTGPMYLLDAAGQDIWPTMTMKAQLPPPIFTPP